MLGPETAAQLEDEADSIPHTASFQTPATKNHPDQRLELVRNTRLQVGEIASPAPMTHEAFSENHPPVAMDVSFSIHVVTIPSSLQRNRGIKSTNASAPALALLPLALAHFRPCSLRF